MFKYFLNIYGNLVLNVQELFWKYQSVWDKLECLKHDFLHKAATGHCTRVVWISHGSCDLHTGRVESPRGVCRVLEKGVKNFDFEIPLSDSINSISNGLSKDNKWEIWNNWNIWKYPRVFWSFWWHSWYALVGSKWRKALRKGIS